MFEAEKIKNLDKELKKRVIGQDEAIESLAKAIKKIDENPSIFLKSETIKNLKAGEKSLAKSPKYNFATQLFWAFANLLIIVFP